MYFLKFFILCFTLSYASYSTAIKGPGAPGHSYLVNTIGVYNTPSCKLTAETIKQSLVDRFSRKHFADWTMRCVKLESGTDIRLSIYLEPFFSWEVTDFEREVRLYNGRRLVGVPLNFRKVVKVNTDVEIYLEGSDGRTFFKTDYFDEFDSLLGYENALKKENTLFYKTRAFQTVLNHLRQKLGETKYWALYSKLPNAYILGSNHTPTITLEGETFFTGKVGKGNIRICDRPETPCR